MRTFKVTGVFRSGKRFKTIHTNNIVHAMGINLFRGSVWEKQANGKWKTIKTVY